ncbi:MAG: VCBS repeat-containing protein [Akkermansiaceae bacterium]|nr:VCBS repeat-containing protein [Akkermansiaceae bacterium]
MGAGLIEPEFPCAEWADFDSDGDLDLLVSGDVAGSVTTLLYTNTAGTFAESGIAFPGLGSASAAWGDYDNDGDLDLAMIGLDAGGNANTRLYRNDGGAAFTPVAQAPFTHVSAGDLAWGDYDNDGDLDLIVTGITEPGGFSTTTLYQNDAGAFFAVGGMPFPNVHSSAVAWGDLDNDGKLDLVITGTSSGTNSIEGGIFRNEGGVFSAVGGAFIPVTTGFAEWGDYDSDGDLDLLSGGTPTAAVRLTRVYENNLGVLTDSGAAVPDLFLSAAGWGDTDNDGDLDIMLSGQGAGARLSRLYRNDGGGSFVDSMETFPDVLLGAVAWADADNDGDADFVLAGQEVGPQDFLEVFENDTTTANLAPAAPGNLAGSVEGMNVLLSWDAGSDGQTPVAGLTYNIRVGTSPGGCEIVSPQSSATGARFLPAPGNAGSNRFASVVNLVPGTYYWTVQTVDSAWLGSAFAAEGSFTVVAAVPEVVSIDLEHGDMLRVTWRGSAYATYRVDESPSLGPLSWTYRVHATADGDGLFDIVEDLGTAPDRNFYRAARP